MQGGMYAVKGMTHLVTATDRRLPIEAKAPTKMLVCSNGCSTMLMHLTGHRHAEVGCLPAYLAGLERIRNAHTARRGPADVTTSGGSHSGTFRLAQLSGGKPHKRQPPFHANLTLSVLTGTCSVQTQTYVS